ncbi:MAG: NUDIX hydrolase [Paracoccus sp. (in: a-proteobacteria)]|uniref:NUDIX hydrolase n=1 Tax=Paracoccus sp. TaxID=267 RepID=UPI0026E02350|nr:NUDIX hydrolase [Paracoccus sp. (in: a-proteobacteria)]MDO5630565.1 NUDIX hydrolase [Paracoccus sp. (in: a-proteobacteria)]
MSANITAAVAVPSAVMPTLKIQVGALCRDPASGKVLLITSRGTGRWIIPKGWPMTDRSDADAAMQEAWEEAGVKGNISRDEIGRYDYDKLNDSTGGIIPVQVRVFTVEVSELADSYPEAGQRTRRWVSPGKAARMVDEKGLKKILRNLPKIEARSGKRK